MSSDLFFFSPKHLSMCHLLSKQLYLLIIIYEVYFEGTGDLVLKKSIKHLLQLHASAGFGDGIST